MTQAPPPAPSSPSTDDTVGETAPSAAIPLPDAEPTRSEEPAGALATVPEPAPERAVARTSRWVWGAVATYLAVYAAMVVLGLTGSSTGQLYAYFAPTTSDPQIVLAKPRPIRSDEWYIQSTWVISQVEQNYPRFSNAYPGETDASVQHDLPVRDWQTIFEPHQWGFFTLPLNQALAVKWWTPSLLMCLAVFAFSILRMPRRPVTAALLGASALLSPFIAWWFLSITVYPIAWAFTILAAVSALLGGRRRLGLVLAGAAGYLTVTTAITIYVPFILAALYPTAALSVGLALVAGRETGLRQVLRRLVPLFAAGAGAAVVAVAWVLTRLDTIKAFLNTSYPGTRSLRTGQSGTAGLVQMLSAPFERDLIGSSNLSLLGGNESEAASFVLIGLALLLPLIALALRQWRRSREVDWVTVSAVAVALFMMAYQFVPGWNVVARLFLLDRVQPSRLLMGWGVLALAVAAYGLERMAAPDLSPRWRLGLTGLALLAAAGIYGIPWLWLVRRVPGLAGSMWIAYLVLALYVLFAIAACWRLPVVAALALVLASAALSWNVNPLYKGYLDMRTTPLGHAIEDVQARDPGQWLVVGASIPAVVAVIETGQQAYDGMQAAPSRVMWHEIDPTNIHVYEWNRLGQLTWVLGYGEPMPRNPSNDVIEMTFDPCGRFAQTYVEHVVTQDPISSSCLRLDRKVPAGTVTYLIYRVQPK